MPIVSLIKFVGIRTAIQAIDQRSRFEYPVEHDGASSGAGANGDEIQIILTGSPDETEAAAILAAVEFPTCEAAVLTVTVNLGTYLVDDATVLTIGIDKFALVCLAIDNVSGVLEVLIFEKTGPLAEYFATPVGNTLVAKLKEFDLVGPNLVEINNFIL